ncbi:MAG: serpin family protein [Candidatus Brocadiia bacterium]
MSKVFVLALLAILGVGATVWYVQRTPVEAPAPAVSETSPLPSPAKTQAPPITDVGFNTFSYRYATEVAHIDGVRNTVFSPFTTYVQLLFLERASNHRLGKVDGEDTRHTARTLDSLFRDPALKYSSDFTVSRGIGIDEWTSREFARNKIAYTVDPASLAAVPSQLDGVDPKNLGATIRGIWTSRFALDCTWEAENAVSVIEAPFQTLAGNTVQRDFVVFECQARYCCIPQGEVLVVEIPYKEGYSLLAVMPGNWDPALAISTLRAVTSGERKLKEKTWSEVSFPRFTCDKADNIDDLLTSLGFFSLYTDGIPLVGTATKGLRCEATIMTKARIICDEHGTRMEAETVAEIDIGDSGERPQPLVLDHPFLYALRHDATGIIVGMGWVVDPTCEPIE